VSHDEYSFDGSKWDNWYVPKGLYEIKYLKDLDLTLIIDPRAINYLLLKL